MAVYVYDDNRIFLSTPSARRATRTACDIKLYDIFLSTPSARRATSGCYADDRRQRISIHALREEGDLRPDLLASSLS